jgi:hypothetical protein
MKAILAAMSMVLLAVACGGGNGDSGQPCGDGGTCLSSCAVSMSSSTSCGLGLTCCAPAQ